jgi:peroxiredoxin family protein
MSDATVDQIDNQKSISLIVTKGTLDWAYPPFILATTALAMDFKVSMFFTFYGLGLLKKKMDLGVTTLGNAAMRMPMMGMHMAMPNLIAAIPGATSLTSAMMKNLTKKKGIASIEELREITIEGEATLIACQMTMDLFEVKQEELIDGPELGGAATYLEVATKSDINLFI